jgi:hypothetical protein
VVVGANRPGVKVNVAGKGAGVTGCFQVLVERPCVGVGCLPGGRGQRRHHWAAVIGQFKSWVTKQLWKIPELAGTPIWQRNYYEHIIRDERDMQMEWDYILCNPVVWDDDDINLKNIGT